MAKARVSINPMYTGGAGGYSFYVRKSEQVVRQRKNNSNYGESASRSEAQMARRVKWGNLVNLYKDMKSWQPKAYDGKVKGQTDYNLFMSLNVNSSLVCLTKDQARNGCAVMDEYQVSRGSLPPITLAKAAGSNDLVSDIAITSAISATRTVGNISQDIISHNPQFKNGDNIAVVLWSQFVDSRQYPYVSCSYSELTLDTESTVEVGTLEVYRFLSSTNSSFLTIQAPASSFGSYTHGVMIHTRKSDYLQVSTQKSVAISSTVANQFSTYEWQQQCIDSYGLDDTVPLDPFDGGSGGEGLPTTYSHTYEGNGNTVVVGPKVQVRPGTYLFQFDPTQWDVESTATGYTVVDLILYDSGGTQVNEEVVRKAEMQSSGIPDGLQIDVPNGANYIEMRIRADEGETVIVSGVMMSN